MKKFVSVMTIIAAVGLSTSVYGHTVKSCAFKRVLLEKEIEIALQYDYPPVQELKKLLAEAKEYCTDSTLLTDAQEKVNYLEKRKNDSCTELEKIRPDLPKANSNKEGLLDLLFHGADNYFKQY
ncbi:DUF1090 family protein [Klebsiella aerogenes]|uniref:DUF1090 family protein n=1 Tax=Klebsiella aerogenes TaxID=548 RepID=UPI002DBD9BC3|nr:DUF1090 family protein [Klebsiella aerogenes]MEB5742671.1 DUF1090 family protein [Klebsiella aerogenes]